jgi:hypothetical protein
VPQPLQKCADSADASGQKKWALCPRLSLIKFDDYVDFEGEAVINYALASIAMRRN